MFTIVGILVVFGAVAGGYLMEHGNLKVLLQPVELLIIGGAGMGTVLIANPLHILKQIVGGIAAAFGASTLIPRPLVRAHIHRLPVRYKTILQSLARS